MGEKITLLSYQMTFSGLTKKLYEETPEVYEKAAIIIRAHELVRVRAKMRRKNKPNTNGTKFTFEALKENEEIIQEAKRINEESIKLGLPELLRIGEQCNGEISNSI